MSELDPSANPTDEELSALMDGEADTGALLRACRHWRQDENQRRTWHQYHMIGDVLRNEDLAPSPDRDAAFLLRLREKLAQEPVILAPEPVVMAEPRTPAAEPRVVNFPSPETRRPRQRSALRRWSAPVGMAAGVALVAGAVFMNQPQAPQVVTLADLAPASAASANPAAAPMDPRVANDAQLVRYFNTHKQFSGVPMDNSSSLRNASFSQPIAVGQ